MYSLHKLNGFKNALYDSFDMFFLVSRSYICSFFCTRKLMPNTNTSSKLKNSLPNNNISDV